MTGASNQLISVSPDELKFQFELEKQSYCDLKVSNTTENNVAFKVKTTSPKKYFVRPNTGVIQPWDSCFIRVTLQAQREFPSDMQCKDKFLLQSTIVASYSDDLPADTFSKDNGRTVEECKLKVVYVTPHSTTGNSEDGSKQGSDANSNQMVQRTREERDAAVRQTQQLQQELDMLKRRRNRKNDLGFSLKFALLVGVIGFMVGILFKLLSSPTTAE
ncbi:vesicle-associated protein 2-1 isoform X1 [Ipomoea triloba]|uniref:vesicle-associated protein 2-1 isoform X1 n=1 Tax=Ipomoea triloba TaxID=35885 RepID=UPI00125D6314|nr:vesicle-associated protein 2-1 isoform X1 [Ipomoea triloba]GLL48630.1 vesicle-associated protein 2-1 isoform X1 [Ipomoea trifida]GMD96080.1 vesicle-associated protein 2-1-like [Ipomoea batatas]GMD98273.1 vesicle-associated protein 2-1-like [Ipomoea batatas]GME12413.1 vesicle-associated protein 2-1-like [Ipomoea batatas]